MLNRNKNIIVLVALLAAASLSLGFFFSDHYKKPVELKEVTVFKNPRDIKAFHLVGTDGKPFTQKNFKNHYTFLFFGFTRCPMVCPTTMAMLNHVYKKLEKKGIKNKLEVVFVSVDSDRDTSQNVKTYVKSFNRHFLGAVGSKQELLQLTHQFNVMFAKIKQDSSYTIEHSNTVLIINPRGQFFGIFSSPRSVNDLINDLEVLL